MGRSSAPKNRLRKLAGAQSALLEAVYPGLQRRRRRQIGVAVCDQDKTFDSWRLPAANHTKIGSTIIVAAADASGYPRLTHIAFALILIGFVERHIFVYMRHSAAEEPARQVHHLAMNITANSSSRPSLSCPACKSHGGHLTLIPESFGSDYLLVPFVEPTSVAR